MDSKKRDTFRPGLVIKENKKEKDINVSVKSFKEKLIFTGLAGLVIFSINIAVSSGTSKVQESNSKVPYGVNLNTEKNIKKEAQQPAALLAESNPKKSSDVYCGNIPTPLPMTLIEGLPTINSDYIYKVLIGYKSPLVKENGAVENLMILGNKYNVNPAIAVGFFIHESSAGTQGLAATTLSLGNIRQTTNSGFEGFQGFRKYPNWKTSAEDWYKLIKNLYIDGWNLKDLVTVVPKYAPSEDNNNPASYTRSVDGFVRNWQLDVCNNLKKPLIKK